MPFDILDHARRNLDFEVDRDNSENRIHAFHEDFRFFFLEFPFSLFPSNLSN
jgi:hypothetical protein